MTLSAEKLDNLAQQSILDPLAKESLQDALSSPPFIPLALNLRDVHDDVRTAKVRPGRIYRAGKSSFSSDLLSKLHVKRIYDLRSEPECKRDPHVGLSDVEIVWHPTQPLTSRMGEQEVDKSSNLLLDSYKSIIHSHAEIFRTLLLDLPNLADQDAVLIHCTAGKDRTGVAVALLLLLAGCSDEEIAREYSLTRIGIEPARERLATALKLAVPQFAPDDPRLQALSESKAQDMLDFLAHLQHTYGGVQAYAEQVLRLTPDQVSEARRAIVL